MRIPFFKEMRIGAYILKQKLLGRKRYPLVFMPSMMAWKSSRLRPKSHTGARRPRVRATGLPA